ncbi:MAG: 3-dehydroquinate synthase [Rhodobacteraceae bacterium]|nr:3-dehydroquinate synthase [Paracoccaceae bacterium]
MRTTVRVDLAGRSYDIVIAPGLLGHAGAEVESLLKRPRVFVITDRTVAHNHGSTLESGLATAGIHAAFMELPPGEATKNWIHLQDVVEWLLVRKVERDDLVLAFGGGVIGDLAGFAAAILRRGVRFVQIPTTLLAQVDSSVGGKTGINSPQGKNLVGAFAQPSKVLADVSVLDTLGRRDYLAGYAEVVKYGLLGDAGFFTWLEQNAAAAARGDVEKRIEAVRRSCQMKAEIVAQDEREHGNRALLNLGHTFGHALEAATGYSNRLLHGEGVSIGCALAFDISARLGLCSQEAPRRVRAHFARLGMRGDIADIPGDLPAADTLVALMQQDKKVRDGTINFIMVRGIGEAFVASGIDLHVVRDVLTEALEP